MNDEKSGPAKPGGKRPAPRRLVIGAIVVCEEGDMLTPEEFGERVGRAMREAIGLSDEQARLARHQGWAGDSSGRNSSVSTGAGVSAMSDDSRWSSAQVARYLNVSPNTVLALARENKLPGVRVGVLWRFDPETVRAYARGELVKEQAPGPFPRSRRRV